MPEDKAAVCQPMPHLEKVYCPCRYSDGRAGQQLNQRLIHLQAPLFDQILNQAPGKLNTLIASGDTLIFSGKTIPEIPEADVVCFGLWLEPEKATNHGVFFCKPRFSRTDAIYVAETIHPENQGTHPRVLFPNGRRHLAPQSESNPIADGPLRLEWENLQKPNSRFLRPVQ